MVKISEIIFGKKSEKCLDKLFVNEKDFEIPHGEDYKIAIQELERIQKQTLHEKQFLSLFEYNDASLWWLIYQSLIPKYKQLTNFTKKFSELIDKTQPQIVKIESNFDKLNIIKQICDQRKIKLQYSTITANLQLSRKKMKKIIQKTHFQKITKTKIEQRKKLYFKKFNHVPSIKNKILFVIPSSYRRNIFDYNKGVSQRGEYLLQPIIDLMNNEDILGMDLDYTFRGDFDILSERLDDSLMRWFPLEFFLQSDINTSDFLKNFSKIINDHEFQNLFYFNEIFLWPDLEEFFNRMIFAPYLPFYLKVINSLERFFKENSPKAIFLPYETGPIALAIILAAKKFGIMTIGLQHGYIYQHNPMYSFSEFRSKNNLLGFIIPDKILLFGNEAKKLLLKNGYPEENLVVLGNPNFFDIEKIDKTLSKKFLREKYNIHKEKKVILFTTGKLQPFYSNHGIYDYDVKIWEHLLENFENNDDYFIILKPHPQEKNIEIYNKLLSKYDSSNAKIIQENIMELIYISSLVVSVFSSTMLDSLCFKKPVIRVQFEGDINSIFDETKVVVKSDLDNLSSTIQEVLKNEKIKHQLLIDTKQFIFDNYGIPVENIKFKIKQILEN